MTKDNNDQKFFDDIFSFYQAFLDNIANTIENLSDIQEKYKDSYSKLKEIQIDPTKLFDMFDDMDNDQQSKLLTFLFKVSTFEERMVNLFKLNAEDQKKLAKDMRGFLDSYKPKKEVE